MRSAPLAVSLLGAALALPVAAHARPAGAGRAPGGTVRATSHVRPRSDAWEARVLELTNDRRRAHHVRPLHASRCAEGFAEPWTRHLARKQVLVHQDLGPMLGCPHTSSAGENIAYGYQTPHDLVSAWMHSAGHRANILDPGFHRLGVSGWRSTTGVTYATQDFLG